MADRPLPSRESLSPESWQPRKQPTSSSVSVPGLSAEAKRSLMAHPGVVGVGMESPTVAVVYLATGAAAAGLPPRVDGILLKFQVIGGVSAR